MKRTIADLLKELETSDEHSRLEAKLGLSASTMETVSAFSNEPSLNGGYLLFGVKKEEGRPYKIVGVSKPDELAQTLSSQCNDKSLNHPVRPLIWTEEVEGHQLVAAYVPEAQASQRPIYLRALGLPKGAFRRIGSADIRCSDEDVRWLNQLASERPYEDALAPDATMSDLDEEILGNYRKTLVERNPATEVRDLSDSELVQALGGAREDQGELRPTVAGVLLFGKASALRRLFPMLRVDYIRVSGTEWVEDTARPFESIDVRQPLLTAFRKVYQAILDDLPKLFEVRAGSPERVESPTVPERVIREALINAISHRDYRAQSPIQVIRFSNRIEFRNAGHSLIDEDHLGNPGSQTRNPRIADVFREMGLAENKGSGIRVMRREMHKVHLARPLFESDRGANRFGATLLFTHLLTDEQTAWLNSLGESALTNEQRIALVYARETGEVRNATLRDLADLETLQASGALRGLRDRGLLELKGAGAHSYYVLAGRAASGVVAPMTSAQADLFEANRGGFLALLPVELQERVTNLGPKARKERVQELIAELCDVRPWTPGELAVLLERESPEKLTETHLNPMRLKGILEWTHPENPSHPEQRYRRVHHYP